MRHFFYELTKEEKKESNKLEKQLFHSNGVPNKEEIESNPEKAFRLEELYTKRNELAIASQN